jgi:hypothetical protein
LNSRVNCRLSMTHLLLHKTPNSVSSEPGAAQFSKFECFKTLMNSDEKGSATPLGQARATSDFDSLPTPARRHTGEVVDRVDEAGP